jgi:hypothetical protein
MDQIPTADLLNLLLMQRASIDLQFQFWLTITFAVIVAAFVAGRRLHYGLRLLAATLYALASIHLALRWMHDGAVGARWVEILETRGVDIGLPWLAVYFRTALMVLGTVSALVFLLRQSWERTGDEGKDS